MLNRLEQSRQMTQIQRSEQLAWERSTANAVAYFEGRSAKIVGITGDRPRVGVSSFAASIARTYGSFGRKTLLIETRSLSSEPSATFGADRESAEDTRGDADEDDGYHQVHNLTVVTLSELGISTATSLEALRSALQAKTASYDNIVVDLPPAMPAPRDIASGAMKVGAACDAVLMLCLTGASNQTQLKDCLQNCTIWGVQISGLVLNDWQVPYASLLADD